MRKIISNNLFMCRYIFKYIKGYAIAHILVQMLFGVFDVYWGVYFSKKMLDAVQYSRPFSSVLIIAGGFIALGVVGNILAAVVNEIYEPQAWQKMSGAIGRELLEKAASIDLQAYDNTTFYNDFVFAAAQADQKAMALLNSIAELLKCSVAVIGMITLVTMFDKVGLIFVGLATAASFIMSNATNKLSYKVDMAQNPHNRKRSYINRVFYLPDFAKEIRQTNVADKLRSDYIEANASLKSVIKQYAKKQFALRFASQYLTSDLLVRVIYSLTLAVRVLLGTVSLGTFSAMTGGIFNIRGNISGVTDQVNNIVKNSLYVESIRTFKAYENVVRDGSQPLPDHSSAEYADKPMLCLKDVTFCYPGCSEPTLRCINMSIKKGEKIAIVGYNGAGKSTLIKLLMRLYDATGGEIEHCGVNIKELNLAEYRDMFGAVFQNFKLFAASLAENVKMGIADNSSEDRLKRALVLSGYADDEDSITLTQNITREFDDEGVVPSGGQAQKLAVSRIFARDCDIAILDEPSAALDPISEYNLNRAMLTYAGERTVIFISHRLSTTKMADRIYMLAGGEVIESGTHDELMEMGGKYAEMFERQSEKYR